MQPIGLIDRLRSNSSPFELERIAYHVVLGAIGGYHLFSRVAHLAKKNLPGITNFPLATFVFFGAVAGASAMIKDPISALTTYLTTSIVLWYFSSGKSDKNKAELLPSYLVDMTENAGRDDSILDIGECKYLESMEIILNRTKKNNVVFVGGAGVGKTAIVEFIAKKIVNKEISPSSPFANKKIWALDLASFMIGTKYIGELEERVDEFLIFADRWKAYGIFFIDEIHMLIGAGRGEKANRDVAGLLKKALARKGISVIGATTPKEYLHLLKDPAFARRFQRVDITEPSMKECIQMFQRQKNYFQKHYINITLTDQAITAAVFFAKRDIRDRSSVDATYDLIDNTCSRIALKSLPLIITPLGVKEIAETHAMFSETVKKFSADDLVKQFDAGTQYYPELFPPAALQSPV